MGRKKPGSFKQRKNPQNLRASLLLGKTANKFKIIIVIYILQLLGGFLFEEYAGQRVLELFFDEPFREFHLREAARKANVSAPTAKIQLDKFAKKGIIEKSSKANLSLFKANTKSKRFQLLKTAYFLEKMEKSGLVEEIKKRLRPQAIVLFGSTARGEDSRESDIDLLVISKNKQDIEQYAFEKKLGREINMTVFFPGEWRKKASEDKPFYQRILIEGIVLEGELPVVE